MTLRQTLGFLSAHAAIVAMAVWFNLAILCKGALKYDQGCGGFGVYIPLWEVFLLPLPLATIILERWRRITPPSLSRLAGYLAVIFVILEFGFLVIDRFPALLATEAIAIGVGVLVRARTARRVSPS